MFNELESEVSLTFPKGVASLLENRKGDDDDDEADDDNDEADDEADVKAGVSP